MNIYTVVMDRVNSEPDWLFLTSKDYPSDEKVIKAIRKHQCLDDDDDFEDYINEFWVEAVYATGYKIKLVKE